MTAEAPALDPPEHVAEIEIPRAGLQMHLMAVAEAIGEPHFLDVGEVERIDKAGDPFGHEMGMVDGERQPERRRLDALEIMAPFLDRMGEVVNLGVLRLLVEVF